MWSTRSADSNKLIVETSDAEMGLPQDQERQGPTNEGEK